MIEIPYRILIFVPFLVYGPIAVDAQKGAVRGVVWDGLTFDRKTGHRVNMLAFFPSATLTVAY